MYLKLSSSLSIYNPEQFFNQIFTRHFGSYDEIFYNQNYLFQANNENLFCRNNH